jgi:putative ATP-grasp target RiPP
MATVGCSRLTEGHSSGESSMYGPISTIISICERESVIAERLAPRCCGPTEQGAWHVADTVMDNPPQTPSDAREGHRFDTHGKTMQPFALTYARSPIPEPETPYAYDPEQQVNLLADGSVAVRDRALLLACGATTSTAGSKTHFDD